VTKQAVVGRFNPKAPPMMNHSIRLLSVLLISAIWVGPAIAADWEKDFVSPPPESRPRCYWYWMDGVFSKEGITRDLEAMKRVGIGNAYIGVISGQGGPAGEKGLSALTDEWWDHLAHAVREGTRLGVDIGFFNCPGWSQSGGPWVKPSEAMRHLVSKESRVSGWSRLSRVPQVETRDFQPVSVLAWRIPKCDADDAVAGGAKVIREGNRVTFELAQPFTARSITVTPGGEVRLQAEYEVSDDGQSYRKVRSFSVDRHRLTPGVGPVALAPVVVAVAPTTARFHRVVFSGPAKGLETVVSAAARIESIAEKSLAKMFQDPLPPFDFYSWPPQPEPESSAFAVDPGEVVDLTGMTAPDGSIDWQVPAGEWMVASFGMVPTATRNGPAPPEATGMEVDKMNRKALASHFDAYVGELHRRLKPEERASWKHVVADSYEMGPQNWTDGFAAKFRETYGYDPIPWLPALTGRVVGSADRSNRFLWDLRRLVAELVASEYVGGLRDLCREKGLRMWLENYGHWGFPSEFLLYGGYCDEISGEFWESGSLGEVELRAASSAAHVYDKNQVFAEAWTGGPSFTSTPWSLKKRGDWALCQGINQFVLHVNIHQPREDRKPGVNAWFGTEFNRHNTWFDASKSWIDYQRRCTVMLQKGIHVADIAYFIGEDAPKMTGICDPPLPPGHDFDFINSDVLLHKAIARDGRLALPHGTSYEVLVLPPIDTMRPEVLRKIGELARGGVKVVGPRPQRAPGMKDFPDNDREVGELAAGLWDSGVIRPVKDLKPVLESIGLMPDLAGVDPKEVLFTHRRAGENHVYFLSNQTDRALDLKPLFRVGAMRPELWDPVTGGMVKPAVYDIMGSQMVVPLRLEPRASVFVVFRGPAAPERIVAVKRGTETVLAAKPDPLAGRQGGGQGFTIACWVNPATDTTLSKEANRGISGMSDARNELMPAAHGNSLVPAGGHAGVGVSVGRNGVVIAEHGGGYFAPVLSHPAAIHGWTHVAVVYQNQGPILYLNGKPARSGLKGPMRPKPSPFGGSFVGGIRDARVIGEALDEAAIGCLAAAMPEDDAGRDELHFTPEGRLLTTFREPGEHVLLRADGTTVSLRSGTKPSALELNGTWALRFPFQSSGDASFHMDGPVPWSSLDDASARYHSGDAVYQTTFELSGEALQGGSRAVLDLGAVDAMAGITLNGVALEVLWAAPYRVDVTRLLRSGSNKLEVRVWNTWHNRLLGAHLKVPGLPEPAPAVTTGIRFPAGAKPLPAGLAGPVMLRFE
jgi:hypothetical protein